MEYKPNDLFVGLVDFFAILLPGGLLTFLLKNTADTQIFGIVLPQIRSQAEGWVVFVFAAYLLGQFTFLVGATFMDKVYDNTYLRYMRRSSDTRHEKAKEMAGADGEIAGVPERAKRRNGDALYKKAKEMAGNNGEIAGVLKWAKAYVRLSSADAAQEIERYEATSKFFRSLFVVLLVYAVAFARHCRWHPLIAILVLLALSFWRFCNQRWKFTECSYIYFIALTAYRETSSGDE